MAHSNTTDMKMNPTVWKANHQYVLDGIPYIKTDFPPTIFDECRTLELNQKDVMIATYPKCGTTWMSEIVYLIQNGVNIEHARQRPLSQRVLYTEMVYPGRAPNIVTLKQMQPPRFMYTHLRSKYFERVMREGKGKVIVVTRNPKDSLVSYFHFYLMNRAINFPGTWDDFFEMAKENGLIYGDYFDWQIDWWQHKDSENVRFVSFENLKKNGIGEIRNVAEFLGKDLSEEELQKIVDATSFDSMKNNPSANHANVPVFDKSKGSFMRKGEVGNWKNFFSLDQSKYIDEKVEQLFKPLGIDIDFE